MIQATAVHHIGIAVKSIDASREFYENVLGATLEGVHLVNGQKVRVAFFRLGPPANQTRLELLEATAADSPIAAFISKRGEGLHHVAVAVDDIQERLRSLKQAGVRLVDEKPRPGAHGTLIAFLHPGAAHGVLVELVEPGAPAPTESADL